MLTPQRKPPPGQSKILICLFAVTTIVFNGLRMNKGLTSSLFATTTQVKRTLRRVNPRKCSLPERLADHPDFTRPGRRGFKKLLVCAVPDEEDMEFFEDFDESKIFPHIKHDEPIGNPKFVPRKRKPSRWDPYDPSCVIDMLPTVERFRDWDFENGDILKGYEFDERDTETRDFVDYIPGGDLDLDDDALYANATTYKDVDPETMKKLRESDPDFLTREEELLIAQKEYYNTPERVEYLEALGEAERSPEVDIPSLVKECLSELEPSSLAVEDLTDDHMPRKQQVIQFSVTSSKFENKTTMQRYHIVNELLEPVYSHGIYFLEGYYRAPSEEGENVVPLVTMQNISNSLTIDVNVTGLDWLNIDSPPREDLPEYYDVDEDPDPEYLGLDPDILRSLPHYDDDWQPHPSQGRLKPHTQNAAYYAIENMIQSRERAKQRAEDLGEIWEEDDE